MPVAGPEALVHVNDTKPLVDSIAPVLEILPEAQYTPGALHKPATDIPPVNVALTALKFPLKVAAPVHVRDSTVASPVGVRGVANPVVVKVAIVKAPAALSAICKYDEALESRRGA